MKTPSDERSTDPHLLAELDESMKVLKDSERELILMKYFQDQTFSAIAAETGRSESAEKMRLKRALEKMAGWFWKRWICRNWKNLAEGCLGLIRRGLDVKWQNDFRGRRGWSF